MEDSIPETHQEYEVMLLSNSSGMSIGTIGEIYTPGGSIPGLLENLTREARLIREPGKSFSYSNAGFNLLELVIQEVTGRDFSAFMKEEILDPLGMVHSGFEWQEDFDPPIPNDYKINGYPVPVYLYTIKGAGGLFSSRRYGSFYFSRNGLRSGD